MKAGSVPRPLLDAAGVKVLAGSGIGSGQYLAKELQENPRAIVLFDEASSFFQQTSMENSTLTSAFKTLFESSSHWSGKSDEQKMGYRCCPLVSVVARHASQLPARLSDQGRVGDGLLSRITLCYVGNKTVIPEWTPRDFARERRLVNKIEDLIPRQLIVPAFEPGARECWQKFVLDVAALSEVGLTPRIVTLTKVDLCYALFFRALPRSRGR